MKVRHLVELLLRFDQDAEVWTDDYHGSQSDGSHGKVRVRQDGKVVRVDRFTGKSKEDREFYRTTLTNSDNGIESYIQSYQHLRAKTKEEADGDLAAGAITQSQYDDDLARIAARAEQIRNHEESCARAEYEKLRARFG